MMMDKRALRAPGKLESEKLKYAKTAAKAKDSKEQNDRQADKKDYCKKDGERWMW